MTLLTGRAVTKQYGRTAALAEADVEVAAGEILAVTGPSGSGKSTLLLCLSGIVTPDSGEVWFAGARLDDRGEAARAVLRRTEIGVLLQHGQLVPELTAVENVALPLLLGGATRGSAARSAEQWLDRFGVAGEAAKRPGELSGGQQQRVALARALVTGPRLLFADEPTGSLDSVAGESVLAALVSAAKDNATAVLLITHDATVAAYADREVHLRDGRVLSGVTA
ncbi:MAG: ABC transporter ATP-binding protein [Hamadaea sp.]|uniref:ABC transporter ATP-binding protein n=1 Tax=Hamadaea sp. TaxID=2024425 RepID=UPI0017A4BBEC|nr:ABC transporter ATP-binding protein [Hamadaea sp.]NUT21827.1 ABC transporter ATP-binding protein [Hamadaea sp.]